MSEERKPDDDALEIPITGELDLHAFAPRDIPSVVREYVLAAQERGILELRLVHGRGKGVQRAVVRQVLAQMPQVRDFEDGDAISGGWGACRVRLHPCKPHQQRS